MDALFNSFMNEVSSIKTVKMKKRRAESYQPGALFPKPGMLRERRRASVSGSTHPPLQRLSDSPGVANLGNCFCCLGPYSPSYTYSSEDGNYADLIVGCSGPFVFYRLWQPLIEMLELASYMTPGSCA